MSGQKILKGQEHGRFADAIVVKPLDNVIIIILVPAASDEVENGGVSFESGSFDIYESISPFSGSLRCAGRETVMFCEHKQSFLFR